MVDSVETEFARHKSQLLTIVAQNSPTGEDALRCVVRGLLIEHLLLVMREKETTSHVMERHANGESPAKSFSYASPEYMGGYGGYRGGMGAIACYRGGMGAKLL